MAKISDITFSLLPETQRSFQAISVALAGFGRVLNWTLRGAETEERFYAGWHRAHPEIPAVLAIRVVHNLAAQTVWDFGQVATTMIALPYSIPRELDGFPPAWRLAHMERQMYRWVGIDNPRGMVYAHLPSVGLIRAYERQHARGRKADRRANRGNGTRGSNAARYRDTAGNFPTPPGNGHDGDNRGEPGPDYSI